MVWPLPSRARRTPWSAFQDGTIETMPMTGIHRLLCGRLGKGSRVLYRGPPVSPLSATLERVTVTGERLFGTAPWRPSPSRIAPGLKETLRKGPGARHSFATRPDCSRRVARIPQKGTYMQPDWFPRPTRPRPLPWLLQPGCPGPKGPLPRTGRGRVNEPWLADASWYGEGVRHPREGCASYPPVPGPFRAQGKGNGRAAFGPPWTGPPGAIACKRYPLATPNAGRNRFPFNNFKFF